MNLHVVRVFILHSDFCTLTFLWNAVRFEGSGVVLLVETLCSQPEDCGFDSQWGNLIFCLLNPSVCTTALGSTRHLTEMNTRDMSWG